MTRPAPLRLGLGLLVGAWIALVLPAGGWPFTVHMAAHMTVVAVASPLIAAGVASGPLDPARRWPGVFAAIPASMAELVLVWGWHAPTLHHAARHTTAGLVAEQASFLAAGLWLWTAALGGPPHLRRPRAGAGVVGLLLTSMHMTLLGALLGLAPRPLYDHGDGALGDQHLGGAVMILVGGVAYLAGGLALAARLLRDAPAGETP